MKNREGSKDMRNFHLVTTNVTGLGIQAGQHCTSAWERTGAVGPDAISTRVWASAQNVSLRAFLKGKSKDNRVCVCHRETDCISVRTESC